MAVTRRISLKKTKVAKPKKTYKQWTESDLLRAMTAVKNHQLSLNGAKRVYGVPIRTIKRYLAGTQIDI